MGKIEKLKKFLEVYNRIEDEYTKTLDTCTEEALRDREYYSGQFSVLQEVFEMMVGDTCVLYFDEKTNHWGIAVKLDHIREFLTNNEES